VPGDEAESDLPPGHDDDEDGDEDEEDE